MLFDPAAAELTPEELLWLAAANTDPRRDVRTEGATLVIDARSKRPGKGGNPARFPNVVTASEATVGLVDRRWTGTGWALSWNRPRGVTAACCSPAVRSGRFRPLPEGM